MCILHNVLRRREALTYTPDAFVDSDNGPGAWHTNSTALVNIVASGSRRSATDAVEMRDRYADYFLSAEGALDYQLDYIQRLQ